MKITCQRDSLTSAFALAASIAPTRSPKEILQNVKLTASGGKLTLSATDMEVGIRLDLDENIDIETEGTALLPVQRTMAILRESNDESLTLETDDSGVRILGSRSKFRLPGNNPDEFPNVSGFEEDKYHVIPTRLLREMIRRTVFATDSETSRYALGGVLLEMEDERVTAVGTDGRRLARMEGTGESVGGHQTSGMTTIVPTRAIQLIERALERSRRDGGRGHTIERPAGSNFQGRYLLASGRRALSELAASLSKTRRCGAIGRDSGTRLCRASSGRNCYRP